MRIVDLQPVLSKEIESDIFAIVLEKNKREFDKNFMQQTVELPKAYLGGDALENKHGILVFDPLVLLKRPLQIAHQNPGHS